MERPLGARLDWVPALAPRRVPLRGPHVALRPLDATTDAEPLFAVSHRPHGDPAIWTYLFEGPYENPAHMAHDLADFEQSEDPLFYAITVDGQPLGMASYLRIIPEHGSIEIGNIWFGAPLRRTTAATEAIYLLARHAFEELHYRRLEWKCNALNAASRRAAERFGFCFEGVFRKHQVVKGRNRDTAWYAIVNDDWPAIRGGCDAWLSPDNFDSAGAQKRGLAKLIAEAPGG